MTVTEMVTMEENDGRGCWRFGWRVFAKVSLEVVEIFT